MSQGIRVLVVDDDVVCARTLRMRLSAHGIESEIRRNGPEALQFLAENPCRVAVIEAILPGIPPARLLDQAAKTRPGLKTIITAAVGNIDTAVELMKKGALDYVRKPLDFEALCSRIQEILATNDQETSIEGSISDKGELDFYLMIGRCPSMQEIYGIIGKVAATNASVLITGESGTGKELVARTIHAINPRSSGRFVTVNCGAIPENLLETEMFGHMRGSFTGAVRDAAGLVEMADGGTVFLDEIGNLSLGLQVKLLRVLQDGEFKPVGSTRTRRVDIRVLAATNADLKEAVQEGTFRDDLYYRLNVVSIHLPPLRERPGDLDLLARSLVASICRDLHRPTVTMEGDFLDALSHYAWPGNIRELRNVLERLVILNEGDRLILDHVPTEMVRQGPDAREIFKLPYARAKKTHDDMFSREYLTRLLRRTEGNISKAAVAGGINRQALHRMLKRYDIHPGLFKPGESTHVAVNSPLDSESMDPT